ncbi:hypothetical protein [Bacillus altitudinis]|uniref:hypothetical protein n=1 Tax=Bacillus altitudinis TaxID=293387 RepID=UPI00240A31C9|nr:hypothetical protein [Bacillus altitudinis]WEZ71220.1 hypothetical protein P5623_19285 [Bacillus altitudinis]
MANWQEKKIKCNVIQGKTEHLIVEYNLQETDIIYQTALQKALVLAEQLNPNGPDGKLRPIEKRETMAFTGAIAELVVLDYLNECFKSVVPQGDVVASPVPGILKTKNSFNQIDIQVSKKSSGKSATIEVRSSNTFKKNTYEMYNQDQSLVGWYVTANKSKEIKKDFYIMLYFRHSADALQDIMQGKKPLTVQVAAGASKAFIEQNGTNSSLKMGSSAQYCIINPIVKAYPVKEVAKQIAQSL